MRRARPGRPLTLPHADTICGPLKRVTAGEAEFPANQIDKSATVARFMVKPHAGLVAGDHHREAALATPAQVLTGAVARLAQQLDDEFRHPGAQLGIEGLPIPPAHRRPRRAYARAPVGPEAAASMHRGWRRQVGTGVWNRIEGVVAPGSAAFSAARATSEPVHPAVLRLSAKG